MTPLWLLRMAKWARYPASAARVKLLLAVIGLCLLLVAIEWLWGWPEALTLSRQPSLRLR